MTESNKLDLIINELGNLKSDMTAIKSDMTAMKSDMTAMKSDMTTMKSDMTAMKSDMSDLKDQLIQTQLHLENKTDRNIELLAENHSTLIDKLNQAIPAANKNLTYEVKVNYLSDRVSALEKEIADLKTKIA